MELWLMLEHKKPSWESPFGHIRFYPVWMDKDGKITNPDSSKESEAGYSNLYINCQYDRQTNDRQPYAWDIEYIGLYSVNLKQARAMARTLESIEKGMKKLDAEWGHPASYGDFVLRAGKVLKAKGLLKLVKNAFTYAEGEILHSKLTDARYQVEYEIADALKE